MERQLNRWSGKRRKVQKKDEKKDTDSAISMLMKKLQEQVFVAEGKAATNPDAAPVKAAKSSRATRPVAEQKYDAPGEGRLGFLSVSGTMQAITHGRCKLSENGEKKKKKK